MKNANPEGQFTAVGEVMNYGLEIGKYQYVDEEALSNYDSLVTEWSERADTLHLREVEHPEVTHDGLGLKFQAATLYHGSAVPGIDHMQPAEETTIGEGIYATSMPEKAFGYARVRSNVNDSPTVYELSVEGVTLADLRNKANIDDFMQGYADVLEGMVASNQFDGTFYKAIGMRERVDEVITMVRNREVTALKLVTWNFTDIFTRYVLESGFDGIIAYEGGEGGDGMSIGTHDTWLIMRPEIAKVSNSVSFEKIVKTDHDTKNAITKKRKELGLEWWEELPEEIEA